MKYLTRIFGKNIYVLERMESKVKSFMHDYIRRVIAGNKKKAEDEKNYEEMNRSRISQQTLSCKSKSV